MKVVIFENQIIINRKRSTRGWIIDLTWMSLLLLCGIIIAIKGSPITLIMIALVIGIVLVIGKYQAERLIVLNISQGTLKRKMINGPKDLDEVVKEYGEVKSIDFYKSYTFQHGGHTIIVEVNGDKKTPIRVSNNWDQKKSDFYNSVEFELMKLELYGVNVKFKE